MMMVLAPLVLILILLVMVVVDTPGPDHTAGDDGGLALPSPIKKPEMMVVMDPLVLITRPEMIVVLSPLVLIKRPEIML